MIRSIRLQDSRYGQQAYLIANKFNDYDESSRRHIVDLRNNHCLKYIYIYTLFVNDFHKLAAFSQLPLFLFIEITTSNVWFALPSWHITYTRQYWICVYSLVIVYNEAHLSQSERLAVLKANFKGKKNPGM